MWTPQGVAVRVSGFAAQVRVLAQRPEAGSVGTTIWLSGKDNLEGEGLMQAA